MKKGLHLAALEEMAGRVRPSERWSYRDDGRWLTVVSYVTELDQVMGVTNCRIRPRNTGKQSFTSLIMEHIVLRLAKSQHYLSKVTSLF